MSLYRIGDLFNIEKGSLQSSKNTAGTFQFITAAEIWKTHHEYTHDCEALVFAAAASGSLGRTHYVYGKFISSDLCFILTEKDKVKYPIDLKFYHFVFNSFKDNIVNQTKAGTSKESINLTNFSNYLIPYFSISLQHRWISKLNIIQEKRLELIKENDEQLKYIQLLRQVILQEAVQGKLVPQNPKDELASELLKQIQAEKEQLIKEGKLKKSKPLSPISKDEIPYELPKGWVWCRLGEIALNIDYGTSQKADNFSDVPVLRMNNIKHGKLDISNLKFISKACKDLPRLYLKNNDIVFNRTNSYELVGKCAVYEDENDKYTLASYLIRLSVIVDKTNSRFVNYYINSKACRETQIEPEITQQTGQANFSGSKLKNILFPFCSFQEQQRIVTKVGQLMQLCDELEQQVQQSKADAEKLLQAILREAFEGKAAAKKDKQLTRVIELSTSHIAAEPEVEYKKTRQVTWEFKEAVLISLLTEKFGSEKFPLGRKRYTKLSYLFHRHLEDEAVKQYLRKAAGPYNPSTRYRGPEKIAMSNKYVSLHKNGKFEGFIKGSDLEKAKHFSSNYWERSAIEWLEQFRFKTNDELELFATVDNALVELYTNEIEITVEQVKNIIKREPEWNEKLKKPIFSNINILRAINELPKLFSYHE